MDGICNAYVFKDTLSIFGRENSWHDVGKTHSTENHI